MPSVYSTAAIFSATGQKLGVPDLPELLNLEPVTTDTVYSPDLNRLYSLTTGAPTWSSVNPRKNQGAIAGHRVVFASGATVRREPY